jgi:hypothetical protein
MTLLLTAIGIGLSLTGNALYFRDVLAGKTKPHFFTWLVWSVLTTIAFAAQIAEGGGIASLVLGVSALFCFVGAFYGARIGNMTFPLADWIALASSGIALFLWWLTDNPLFSVILITLTDAVAFIPTFRKSYHRPYEETLSAYLIAAIKFIPGIIALEVLTLTTWLYPGSLLVMNTAFVLLLVVRRRQIVKSNNTLTA